MEIAYDKWGWTHKKLTMNNNPPVEPQPSLFYEDRFWEHYVGQKLVDRVTV